MSEIDIPSAGGDERSGTLLLLMSPLFVFASSAASWATMCARAVIVLTFVKVAAISGSAGRSKSRLVALCMAGLFAAAAVEADLSSIGAWTAVLQLLILFTIVSRHRVVYADPALRHRLIWMLVACGFIALAITVSKSPSEDFDRWTSGPFGNPNAFGLVGLTLAILSILASTSARDASRAATRLSFIACCAIVLISGSRTAAGALLVFLVVYGAGSRVANNRVVLAATFASALIAIPIVTIGYTYYIVDTPLEELQLGEKQILSGRNAIWPVVLVISAERPAFGHGLGRVPAEDIPDEASSHNGFLQIFYQAGGIGLAFYALLFVALVRRALALGDPRERAASVAVVCAAIVCELFEVLLTQNHFGIGIVLWILATTTIRSRTDQPAGSNPAPVLLPINA